ncbi:MAG: alginate lyase family protein, partial [Planctomycetales bacterium]
MKYHFLCPLLFVLLALAGKSLVMAEDPVVFDVRGETQVQIPAELPPHPRIFLTADEIQELKAWVAREPWLREYVDRFLSSTRRQIGASRLPSSTFLGNENLGIGQRANEFALAYVLTNEEVFAKAAARILLAYVPIYEEYPVSETKGKAMPSALVEALWAAEIASAYDLIYHSDALSVADRQAIEQKVLKPCGEVIRICNHHTRSNWRARAIAGTGIIGFCIDDRELINEALNGFHDADGKLLRYGFVHHLARSILADGIFYERSFSYQLSTTGSYTLLMEAARHNGIDLWNLKVSPHDLDAGADVEHAFGKSGNKSIKPMFDALFYQTFSDGTVSAVANSSIDMFSSRRFYESAWRAFRDPKFALAARIPHNAKRPWAEVKSSNLARLKGPTSLMFLDPELPQGSFNLADEVTIGHTGRHANGC